jgi:probable HAF family extracellular repeat protein
MLRARLLVFLGLLLAGAPAFAAAQYDLVDLGAGGDVARLVIYQGVLTAVGQRQGQAVLWQRGQPPMPQGFLPEGTFSLLNGGGPEALVGYSGTGHLSLETHAMLIEGGQRIDLGTLGSPDLFSAATGLNAKTIIGYCTTPQVTVAPCTWARPHAMAQALVTLGGRHGRLAAINARGQMVGQAQTATGEDHAGLWEQGQVTDLTPGTGIHSDAKDINRRGVIVGLRQQEAVRWSPPAYAPEDLGRFSGDVLTQLVAVNDEGLAVGTSIPPCTPAPPLCAPSRAIRLTGTTLEDLNTLVDAPGWVLETALGVTDTGAIAGSGTLHGETHVWLLVPKQSAQRTDEGRE